MGLLNPSDQIDVWDVGLEERIESKIQVCTSTFYIPENGLIFRLSLLSQLEYIVRVRSTEVRVMLGFS